MRILLTFFLLLSPLSFGGSASATIFDVSGSGTGTGGFPSENISGTITIDTTTGTITAVQVFVPGIFSQNVGGATSIDRSSGQVGNQFTIIFPQATGDINRFSVPDSGSLVGYQGGNFSFDFLHDPLTGAPTTGVSGSGTLTPEVSATPLPAALPLFASALAAAGLVRLRRKRKAAALAA